MIKSIMLITYAFLFLLGLFIYDIFAPRYS